MGCKQGTVCQGLAQASLQELLEFNGEVHCLTLVRACVSCVCSGL